MHIKVKVYITSEHGEVSMKTFVVRNVISFYSNDKILVTMTKIKPNRSPTSITSSTDSCGSGADLPRCLWMMNLHFIYFQT